MGRIYSTYEAKARLSEVIKRVRGGEIVTITYRGEPVAEVHPVERPAGSLAARLDELRRSGLLSKPRKKSKFTPLAKRSGALRRFLESRE